MKPERAGSKELAPINSPLCGFEPTSTTLCDSRAEKIVSVTKRLCGSKPLKKRPVNEAFLRKLAVKFLPERKFITVQRTHSILENCSSIDIERQGLQKKMTYHNSKREALFKLLLKRQLQRESTKAKKHFVEHYGKHVRSYLLGKLQCNQRPVPYSPVQRTRTVHNLTQACASSSVSASFLSHELPHHRHGSNYHSPMHSSSLTMPQPTHARIVYDYAHCA